MNNLQDIKKVEFLGCELFKKDEQNFFNSTVCGVPLIFVFLTIFGIAVYRSMKKK
jgi:hypothetical protein